MSEVAISLGVEMICDAEVSRLNFRGSRIESVIASSKEYEAEVVVGSADYHHVESKLLPENLRAYSEKYWNTRKLAPSAIMYYLGVNKKLESIKHHNLFFDGDYEAHVRDIYDSPAWPEKPAIYVSRTSATDPIVAPEGMENLTILIPVAPGLEDNEEIRERYYNYIMDKLEATTGTGIRDHVVYKKSYAQSDFTSDYNSFKGNAYGLANTLMQTAVLKPKMKSKKVDNLFYTGQLTVPGPGVPPSLISGKVVSGEISKFFPH
jgi:phytoene desaturase